MQNNLLGSLFKKQFIRNNLFIANILLRPLFQKQLIYAKQLIMIFFFKIQLIQNNLFMKNNLLGSLFKKVTPIYQIHKNQIHIFNLICQIPSKLFIIYNTFIIHVEILVHTNLLSRLKKIIRPLNKKLKCLE